MGRLQALFLVGVMGALTGCRTPFMPPTVPIANLYPTLNSGGVLDTCRPLRLAEREVSALLANLGLLEPLRSAGMDPGAVALAARGLSRHGYAELDARRSTCPVRWVVLRGLEEEGGTWLVVEAGMAAAAPPPIPAECRVDLSAAPATRQVRTDIYGRRSQVESWAGALGPAAVEVRRVTSAAQASYWELEYRSLFPD